MIQGHDESPDYGTPAEVLDLVRRVIGPIGLDPCTTVANPAEARFFYYEQDGFGGGLLQGWTGRGPVFMNPPYGRGIHTWVGKLIDEWPEEAIALLPARTDTAWFQAIAPVCGAVCWWKGRIVFIDPATGKAAVDKEGRPQTGKFPSVVTYWGPRPRRFRTVFGERGLIL